MFYEAELFLLRETFRKCRIHTALAELSKPLPQYPETVVHELIVQLMDLEKPLGEYVSTVRSATIYRLRDPFDCRYTYILLPDMPQETVLTIGPYLSSVPTQDQLMEWAERNQISPSHLQLVESYYRSVPILQDTSHLFTLLDAFAQRIWGTASITVEDIYQDFSPSALLGKKPESDDDKIVWDMRSMEQLYSCENELMEAVSKGQLHKADMLLANLASFTFEQRVDDPMRNMKNYCIIMNTLLRKAAERGGVHPMYIHNTSSDFAVQIERVHSIEAIPTLIGDMFRDYCRLVRRHSLKDYSPPVQKALLHIDGNLTENLTLRSLAENFNVSPSYLSSLFRKETGYTLTDYINRRRVRHAMHLLKTTRLQVQTVAQHCGMMDVQYFSKIFKKVAGMTPKEYRNSVSQTAGG